MILLVVGNGQRSDCLIDRHLVTHLDRNIDHILIDTEKVAMLDQNGGILSEACERENSPHFAIEDTFHGVAGITCDVDTVVVYGEVVVQVVALLSEAVDNHAATNGIWHFALILTELTAQHHIGIDLSLCSFVFLLVLGDDKVVDFALRLFDFASSRGCLFFEVFLGFGELIDLLLVVSLVAI